MAAGARDDRRRRMLSDGARSAGNAADGTTGSDPVDSTPHKKRRFSPDAASPSFAVARGVLPTTGGSLAATVAAGLAAGGGVLAGHYFHSSLPAALSGPLNLASTSSLGGWLAGTLTLVAAGLCGVIFGLRSNRTDDVRGLYRWWAAAACALIAVSALYAVGAGPLVAQQLSSATGFAPLGGAGWWMAALVLAAAGLGVRPVADLAESRLSLSLAVVGALGIVASWSGASRALPAGVSEHAQLVESGGLLIGLVFGIGAQLAYVRRVLLETDGVIAAPVKKQKFAKPAALSEAATETRKPSMKAASEPAPKTVKFEKPELSAAEVADDAASSSRADRRAARRKQEPAAESESRWTDGSEGDVDYEDDAPRRKLSKAERKRIRKQKAGERYAA